MTPCSTLSCTRRFGGTYPLHLQGRRIVQQTSEQAGGKQNARQSEDGIYREQGVRPSSYWFVLRQNKTVNTHGLNHRTNRKTRSECVVLKRKKRYVSPKRRVQLNVLHGVISQKMILFITTAVKT
jgi:hypothetical protein